MVQNEDLWDKYFTERRDIHSRKPAGEAWASVGNELWLVHGTASTKPEAIYKSHGFDWRYSRTTCFFGQASYFAVQPKYSGTFGVGTVRTLTRGVGFDRGGETWVVVAVLPMWGCAWAADDGYSYQDEGLPEGAAQMFLARVAVGRVEDRRREDSGSVHCPLPANVAIAHTYMHTPPHPCSHGGLHVIVRWSHDRVALCCHFCTHSPLSSVRGLKCPTMGYDSVRGCVKDPDYMAYMVYELRKSYPAYLVTYQRS